RTTSSIESPGRIRSFFTTSAGMTRPIELPHFFAFVSTSQVIPKVIHRSIGVVRESRPCHGEGRAKTSYSIVSRCKTAGVAEAAHSADRRFSRRRRIAPVTIKATPPDPEIVATEARGIGCGGGFRNPREG